jgi:hypothetical protein
MRWRAQLCATRFAQVENVRIKSLKTNQMFAKSSDLSFRAKIQLSNSG